MPVQLRAREELDASSIARKRLWRRFEPGVLIRWNGRDLPGDERGVGVVRQAGLLKQLFHRQTGGLPERAMVQVGKLSDSSCPRNEPGLPEGVGGRRGVAQVAEDRISTSAREVAGNGFGRADGRHGLVEGLLEDVDAWRHRPRRRRRVKAREAEAQLFHTKRHAEVVRDEAGVLPLVGTTAGRQQRAAGNPCIRIAQASRKGRGIKPSGQLEQNRPVDSGPRLGGRSDCMANAGSGLVDVAEASSGGNEVPRAPEALGGGGRARHVEQASRQQLSDPRKPGALGHHVWVHEAVGQEFPVDVLPVELVACRYRNVGSRESLFRFHGVNARNPTRRVTQDGHFSPAIRARLEQDVLPPAVPQDEVPKLSAIREGRELRLYIEWGSVVPEKAAYQDPSTGNRHGRRLLRREHADLPGTPSGYEAGRPLPIAENRYVAIRHQIVLIGV